MSITTPSAEQDRRRFLRIQFDGTTELIANEQIHPVELLDLSLKGALIKSDTPLPCQPNDQLQMNIHLTDNGLALTFTTVLVRIIGDSYGLRFDAIDLDTMTHLRRIMELNLGDENLLERELDHLFPLH